jgi:hypothetical protein
MIMIFKAQGAIAGVPIIAICGVISETTLSVSGIT